MQNPQKKFKFQIMYQSAQNQSQNSSAYSYGPFSNQINNIYFAIQADSLLYHTSSSAAQKWDCIIPPIAMNTPSESSNWVKNTSDVCIIVSILRCTERRRREHSSEFVRESEFERFIYRERKDPEGVLVILPYLDRKICLT